MTIVVSRKPIKQLYLRIDPRTANIKLSAPRQISYRAIEQFVIDKQDWIKKHQARILAQEKIINKQYVSGEILLLWGKPYPLKVVERRGRHGASLTRDGKIQLTIRPNTTMANREKVLKHWYRQQMDLAIATLFDKWQPIMKQTVRSWQVRQMKSRWGSCHIDKRHIVLNLTLVSKPLLCLEYVLVHEMIHLFERYHNARFYRLMDYYLPEWRTYKRQLNASV